MRFDGFVLPESLHSLVLKDSDIARDDRERWPDVRNFVDPMWDPRERQAVADHLAGAVRVNEYRGLSPCRLCGQYNGSAERTDGVYCWPEGLGHYVIDHQLRLPDEFVTHVLSSTPLGPSGVPNQLDSRSIDRLSELWSADLGVASDPTWWLDQVGF